MSFLRALVFCQYLEKIAETKVTKKNCEGGSDMTHARCS